MYETIGSIIVGTGLIIGGLAMLATLIQMAIWYVTGHDAWNDFDGSFLNPVIKLWNKAFTNGCSWDFAYVDHIGLALLVAFLIIIGSIVIAMMWPLAIVAGIVYGCLRLARWFYKTKKILTAAQEEKE